MKRLILHFNVIRKEDAVVTSPQIQKIRRMQHTFRLKKKKKERQPSLLASYLVFIQALK